MTKTELRYGELRNTGMRPFEVGAALGLTENYRTRLEERYAAERFGTGGDATLPRFAYHARYIEALRPTGGFPALSERIGKSGAPVVCLPIVYPEAF